MPGGRRVPSRAAKFFHAAVPLVRGEPVPRLETRLLDGGYLGFSEGLLPERHAVLLLHGHGKNNVVMVVCSALVVVWCGLFLGCAFPACFSICSRAW